MKVQIKVQQMLEDIASDSVYSLLRDRGEDSIAQLLEDCSADTSSAICRSLALTRGRQEEVLRSRRAISITQDAQASIIAPATVVAVPPTAAKSMFMLSTIALK